MVPGAALGQELREPVGHGAPVLSSRQGIVRCMLSSLLGAPFGTQPQSTPQLKSVIPYRLPRSPRSTWTISPPIPGGALGPRTLVSGSALREVLLGLGLSPSSCEPFSSPTLLKHGDVALTNV